MDANKLEKLKEIGYVVRNTCDNCVFATFLPGQDWATCTFHVYKHRKHSVSERALSIHKSGHCSTHLPESVDPTWEELRETHD